MQISTTKDNHLEIKTKKAVISINDEIRINDVVLEGPGEYEIAEVSVEGVSDDIYLCQAEEIYFGLVDFKEKLSKEAIEKISNVSVLIARLNGEIEQSLEQIGQAEPNITIYLGSVGTDDKISKAGVTLDRQDSVKISKTDVDGEQKAYFFPL